jgi:hypothetical protein
MTYTSNYLVTTKCERESSIYFNCNLVVPYTGNIFSMGTSSKKQLDPTDCKLFHSSIVCVS